MPTQNSGTTATLFITVQYLKDNSVINDNVDENVLQPVIKMVHDKYLHQIIGSQLYYTLQNKIVTNTLTGDYLFLMTNFIVPYLLHYSTYESVPYMAFKMRNKGVQKQSSPDSTPVDLTELSFLRDNILDTAQFYGERLIEYLCANSSSFPEYNSQTNGDMPGANSDYFSGIHIPGANRGPSGMKGYGFDIPLT